MRSLIASMAAAVTMAGTACAGDGPDREVITGSGNLKTEVREVEKFDRVSVRGSGDVKITIGDVQTVKVTADDNILPTYETTVDRGELILKPTQSIQPKTQIVVEITVPSLTAASIAGSGDIDAAGLNEKAVSFAIAGSGDITAAGTAGTVSSAIKGSGSIDTSKLATKDATVTVAGSGDITVNATDRLTVNIAGSGDVRHVGKPKNITKNIRGQGDVREAAPGDARSN
jgi:hypothetical protein